MEIEIMSKLHWDVWVPTPFHFLQRFLKDIKCCGNFSHLVSYYAERNLQEKILLAVSPSKYAASAIYCALKQQITQYRIPTFAIWDMGKEVG
jgi:transcription initiation factor TFIIIB Brf1 subunit/transcription initiation factor TFIIB